MGLNLGQATRRSRTAEIEREKSAQRRRKWIRWGAIAAAVIAVAAAGLVWNEMPPSLVSVTGTVTVDGKPLDAVEVYFWPSGRQDKSDRQYRTATAITDANGRFVLKGFSGESGIAQGNYKVTFSRLVARGRPVAGDTRKSTRDGAKQSIPTRYLEPGQTPIDATVSSSQRDFAFEVPSK